MLVKHSGGQGVHSFRLLIRFLNRNVEWKVWKNWWIQAYQVVLPKECAVIGHQIWQALWLSRLVQLISTLLADFPQCIPLGQQQAVAVDMPMLKRHSYSLYRPSRARFKLVQCRSTSPRFSACGKLCAASPAPLFVPGLLREVQGADCSGDTPHG